MTTTTRIAIGFLATALIAAVGFCWLNSRSNEFARISWRTGGEAMVGVFVVSDSSGHPVAGATVQGWNNAGLNQGITDTNGVAMIRFAERELSAIDVDGKRVLNRMGKFKRPLFVVNGLHVQIKLK